MGPQPSSPHTPGLEVCVWPHQGLQRMGRGVCWARNRRGAPDGAGMEWGQSPGLEGHGGAGPKDSNSRRDEGLQPGVSGLGSPSLVLGASLAN